jgi:phosphomannomutase
VFAGGFALCSVGRDCRLSGEEISMALMSGMTSNSINTAVTADHTHVVDVGPCTTPG